MNFSIDAAHCEKAPSYPSPNQERMNATRREKLRAINFISRISEHLSELQ